MPFSACVGMDSPQKNRITRWTEVCLHQNKCFFRIEPLMTALSGMPHLPIFAATEDLQPPATLHSV
jgi:hypothetical protein